MKAEKPPGKLLEEAPLRFEISEYEYMDLGSTEFDRRARVADRCRSILKRHTPSCAECPKVKTESFDDCHRRYKRFGISCGTTRCTQVRAVPEDPLRVWFDEYATVLRPRSLEKETIAPRPEYEASVDSAIRRKLELEKSKKEEFRKNSLLDSLTQRAEKVHFPERSPDTPVTGVEDAW